MDVPYCRLMYHPWMYHMYDTNVPKCISLSHKVFLGRSPNPSYPVQDKVVNENL